MSLTPETLRDLPEITAMAEFRSMGSVTPKGDHWLSQRYSELYLNTPSKPLHWLSKKCRWQDLNSQPQWPLLGLILSLMLQMARFYARLYYHAQTWAHNLLRQKVITDWVSAIVSYILTGSPVTAATAEVTETTETVIADLRTGAEEDWLNFSLPEAIRVIVNLSCWWCSCCILSSILR